ncbi:MAG: DUF1801 domain-containing protein [Actinomycetia bacterium]|nr:DUF1801 domain-containing protein [Actinomycetes bacterium]
MSDEQIEAYLNDVPEPQRSTLQTLRAAMVALVPEAEPGLAYGVPAYRVHGKLVGGFGAAQSHCSYYPMSGTILPLLAADLAGYTWSKGALRFGIDTPLPQELLEQLIVMRLDQIES